MVAVTEANGNGGNSDDDGGHWAGRDDVGGGATILTHSSGDTIVP